MRRIIYFLSILVSSCAFNHGESGKSAQADESISSDTLVLASPPIEKGWKFSIREESDKPYREDPEKAYFVDASYDGEELFANYVFTRDIFASQDLVPADFVILYAKQENSDSSSIMFCCCMPGTDYVIEVTAAFSTSGQIYLSAETLDTQHEEGYVDYPDVFTPYPYLIYQADNGELLQLMDDSTGLPQVIDSLQYTDNRLLVVLKEKREEGIFVTVANIHSSEILGEGIIESCNNLYAYLCESEVDDHNPRVHVEASEDSPYVEFESGYPRLLVRAIDFTGNWIKIQTVLPDSLEEITGWVSHNEYSCYRGYDKSLLQRIRELQQ